MKKIFGILVMMLMLLSAILPLSVGLKNTSDCFLDETDLAIPDDPVPCYANANCIMIAYGKLTGLWGNMIAPFIISEFRWGMNPGSCWTLGTSGIQKCQNAWYIGGTADYIFFGMVIGNLNGNTLIFGTSKWVGVQVLG